MEAIESYKELKLSGKTVTESALHYIGSVGQSRHLLMITKTAMPPKVEVEPGVFKVRGRPWDHVFKYYISTEEMTIINGWDISVRLKGDGFEVRPSYCPRLKINPKQKKYHINPHAEIKAANGLTHCYSVMKITFIINILTWLPLTLSTE